MKKILFLLITLCATHTTYTSDHDPLPFLFSPYNMEFFSQVGKSAGNTLQRSCAKIVHAVKMCGRGHRAHHDGEEARALLSLEHAHQD